MKKSLIIWLTLIISFIASVLARLRSSVLKMKAKEEINPIDSDDDTRGSALTARRSLASGLRGRKGARGGFGRGRL
mgnify:CR=1 FL=1